MNQRGTILKAIRIFKGMSQSELAIGSGYSVTTLNSWENNKRDIPDKKMFELIRVMGGEVDLTCTLIVEGMKVEMPGGDNKI